MVKGKLIRGFKTKTIAPIILDRLFNEMGEGEIDYRLRKKIIKNNDNSKQDHLMKAVLYDYSAGKNLEGTIDFNSLVGSIEILTPEGIGRLTFYGNNTPLNTKDVSKYLEEFRDKEFILLESHEYDRFYHNHESYCRLYTLDFKQIPSVIGKEFSLKDSDLGDKACRYKFGSIQRFIPKEVYEMAVNKLGHIGCL